MTSNQFKRLLEHKGFSIVHVRKTPRGAELRAYGVSHEEHYDVNEIRYNPEFDDGLRCYQYCTRPNGYTQFDRHIGDLSLTEEDEA